MNSFHHTLQVATRGKGLYPFTREVARWIALNRVQSGLLTIFVQHTSASLVIQENADPDVVLDLADFFERLAPEDDPHCRHTTEGSDDMPAHIRAKRRSRAQQLGTIGRGEFRSDRLCRKRLRRKQVPIRQHA